MIESNTLPFDRGTGLAVQTYWQRLVTFWGGVRRSVLALGLVVGVFEANRIYPSPRPPGAWIGVLGLLLIAGTLHWFIYRPGYHSLSTPRNLSREGSVLASMVHSSLVHFGGDVSPIRQIRIAFLFERVGNRTWYRRSLGLWVRGVLLSIGLRALAELIGFPVMIVSTALLMLFLVLSFAGIMVLSIFAIVVGLHYFETMARIRDRLENETESKEKTP